MRKMMVVDLSFDKCIMDIWNW